MFKNTLVKTALKMRTYTHLLKIKLLLNKQLQFQIQKKA